MRNLHANQKCWLIADPDGRMTTLVAQFARLRGLEVRELRGDQGSLPSSGSDALVASSFTALSQMSPHDRESLRASVELGATLYLRGGIENGVRYSLAPLIDLTFTVSGIARVTRGRFTDQEMIPAVLRGEQISFPDVLNGAYDLSGSVEPILLARDENGAESPVVFACRAGKGAIICDVQPDDETSDAPLIWRLADPVQRCRIVSALIAVDRAAGRDLSAPVPFNLTIDDIPLGYDYLNESMLEDFMLHLESRCAGAHLDCAWIPTSQRMSRRYVEILKAHGAGFLWHGMNRHVDHQKIADPSRDMEAGKRAMAINAQRYGVHFQPMIIFPFERAHRSAEELVLKEGFLAGAEQPRHDEGAAVPAYLRYSEDSCMHDSGLRFLHRYESQFLTRDRMLALGSLGMPVLAFGHPRDVRLRRLSGIMERGGTFAHFDHVLDFAAEKGLPGRSLEAIAH